MKVEVRDQLAQLVEETVKWDCPLIPYTSFGIGGPAQAVALAKTEKELQDLLLFFKRENIVWRVIGRGTNLVVDDHGFAGVVVILGGDFKHISSCEKDNDCAVVSVAAGCSLTQLSNFCVDSGYAGLEFVLGIPGTVGGAVVMNAGAWGFDISGNIESVTVMSAQGKEVFSRKQLSFAYRRWLDYEKMWQNSVVIGAELSVTKSSQIQVQQRCEQIRANRQKAQPIVLPNAGSFFKNPKNESAGKLIELCGLKGMRVGNVMVAKEHANFFVNLGGGTAADLRKLMEQVQEKVLLQCSVELKPEVHFL